jgi:chemotaxis-related protein WspB
MLFLLLYVGMDRYVLAVSQVVTVIPAVLWTAVPDVPRGVMGLFDYHGTAVPLVDLSELLRGTPSDVRMSTRIVVVDLADVMGESGAQGTTLLGVLVECVMGTLRRDESDFVDASVIASGAPYVGPVLTDGEGIIQRLTIEQLLPVGVRDRMLRQCISTT